MEIRFDTYYGNAELEEALRWLAGEHPDLVRLSTLGVSHEGRDLWLLTVTDHTVGVADDKPAMWVDGNLHSVELAGSMAALHLAVTLVDRHVDDEAVQNLLASTTFYIAPRVNPDGVERVLSGAPWVRSGTRPFPYEDPDPTGLHPEDINGDGRILEMRIVDPTGPLKLSEDDPRLLVRREPDDHGGTYYRVFPEGSVRDHDGHTIRVGRPLEGLDFNRNFPAGWVEHASQQGAGPYPLSEPETRALADFVGSHPNIVIALNYHTYSGVHLRPAGFQPDDELPIEDLWTYEVLGERATAITGYPAVSIYHGFAYHPRKGLHGAWLDWWYDQLGLLAWVTELWDITARAGVDREHVTDWFRHHDPADDLAILRWNDEHLDGRGFVEWTWFDHPQIGPVEIGGWDRLYTWNNPPHHLLEAELAPNTEWVISQAGLAPHLAVRDLAVEALAGDTHRVTLAIENTGFLPTYGMKQALERSRVRPVRARVDGATVRSGDPEVEVGHLEGRSASLHFATWNPSGISDTTNRAVVEWVVSAAPGTQITVDVLSERAGTLHLTTTLP